ncbi:ankyrin repeat domain-containing protein 31-like [Phalacrocorax carbo]|uniref:ankyrin repeat domain-containing protein 31-like n=1 Tax=Phalacrocorax carbo TaxID=9209 RepID=UPI00311937FB
MWASVESFKKGALRKQLVNLASRQKSLLTIAQNQEELVQKIQNYRKTKQTFSVLCSEKQISTLVISCGNDKRQSLTADEIICPDVVTFSMRLGASMPNGNTVEADLSLENGFSAQECSQHPHICLGETGANKEAIRSKEASDHALASENRVREYPFNNMSRLTNAVQVVTLPSESTVSTAKTKCSQQKDIDFIPITEQGNKSLNPTFVTNALNIVEPQSTAVNDCQPGSDRQQVLTDEDLLRHVNKKEAFQHQQQQQVILSTRRDNFPDTLQQMVLQSSENSLNANSVLTNLTSNADYPVNFSEKSSQSCSNQECEQKQVKYRRKSRKKLQLIDLLELGRIKPGENVLEFKLQHVASEPCEIRPLSPPKSSTDVSNREICPERRPSPGGDTGSHSPLRSQIAQKVSLYVASCRVEMIVFGQYFTFWPQFWYTNQAEDSPGVDRDCLVPKSL